MSKLILLPPGATPITHELTEELVTIGRRPDNHIQVDDPSVSGRHAQLHKVGETIHLQDLESTNGTLVNGDAVTSVALRFGDRIRFGKVEARFESEAGTGTEPLPVLVETEARPAEVSAKPVDFENASPFPRRKSQKDPARTAIFALVALAILALLGSMIALAQMQPPTP